MNGNIGNAFVNANQGAFNAFWNAMTTMERREWLRGLACYAIGAKFGKDGDQYFFLLGENLQNGIVGFGKTPHDAALAFEKLYYNGEVTDESTPGSRG